MDLNLGASHSMEKKNADTDIHKPHELLLPHDAGMICFSSPHVLMYYGADVWSDGVEGSTITVPFQPISSSILSEGLACFSSPHQLPLLLQLTSYDSWSRPRQATLSARIY